MSLGAAHHASIVAYWRKKYEAIALCRMAGDPEQLPQLMAARKATPALRRFKKKLAARGEGGTGPAAAGAEGKGEGGAEGGAADEAAAAAPAAAGRRAKKARATE